MKYFVIIYAFICLVVGGDVMAKDWRPALRIDTYYIKENNVVKKKAVESLAKRQANSLIGQSVLDINFNLGTYGMGGPGFVGLLLESSEGKKEWMVFTIWGADWSILCNGQWVGAHPMFYDKQKPLRSNIYSNGKVLEWDYFTGLIKSFKIINAKLDDKNFIISLEREGKHNTLEVLDKDSRLPPMPNGGDRYTLRESDKLGDFIIFMEEGGIIDTTENTKPA